MERRGRRLRRERPLRSGSERRRKLPATRIPNGGRGWAPAVDASSIGPVAFASHHSRLVRAASRRLLRRVACLLRLSQGFVDTLFKRISLSGLDCGRRLGRGRRIGRGLDLLSVGSQPVVDGLFAVRELLAARVSGRFLQRPAIRANEGRCAFLAAAAFERLIEVRAAAADRYRHCKHREHQPFPAAFGGRYMIAFQLVFVGEEVLVKLVFLSGEVVIHAAPVILAKSVLVSPAIFEVTIVIILRRIGIRRVLRRRRGRRSRIPPISLRGALLMRLLVRQEKS